MVVSRKRSRRESFDGVDLGLVAPLGTWRPDGDASLVLPFRSGTRGAIVVGLLACAFGGYLLVWGLWLGAYREEIVGNPVGRLVAVLLGVASLVVGGFALVAAYYRRRAVVVIGPRGIAYLRRSAAGLRESIETVEWDELAQVGICVKIARTIRPARIGHTTHTDVSIRLGLLPRVAGFGGWKLPSFEPGFVAPPYTHGIAIPSPGMLCDGEDLPVLRDLHAALRHFALEIYAGMDKDVTLRDLRVRFARPGAAGWPKRRDDP